MHKNKNENKPQARPKTSRTIAVMCRFTEEEIGHMKSATLANATATAVAIYCRKHIQAERGRP